MKKFTMMALVFAAVLCLFAATPSFAQGPSATPPYNLSVFANAPAGLSAPDSIAVRGNRVFVGYGDGHDPGGADGLNSQVVEFRMDGSVAHIYTVPGHNDGVKLDPTTGKIWAMQNEDANPNLVIINPETRHQKLFTFGPTPHGGGYDDMVFQGCKVYISASNPANSPNAAPAIVSAHIEGNMVEVESVFEGNAGAFNVVTGETETLNLQDPDSMTTDLLGNLFLDSQGDQEIILVANPGTNHQTAFKIPLSFISGGTQTAVETDDSAFVTSTQGFILFADKKLNKVYKLTNPNFFPGGVFTAADGGPFVGTLDLATGIITPVVTNLMNPGGLVFVDTSDKSRDSERFDRDDCDRDRDSR